MEITPLKPARIFRIQPAPNQPEKFAVRLIRDGKTINFLKDIFDTVDIAISSALQIAGQMMPACVALDTRENVTAIIFPQEAEE